MAEDIKKEEFELKTITSENILNKDGFYITVRIPGTQAAAFENYDVFFHVRSACEIVWVTETHRVIGSDGGSVTVNIERLDSGTALDAGDEILKTAFDLKGTVSTPVIKEGTIDLQNTILSPNQRLALKDSGTLTAVTGLCVTLFIKPLSRGHYN